MRWSLGGALPLLALALVACETQPPPAPKGAPERAAEVQARSMPAVSFDHDAHLTYGYACTDCHHTHPKGAQPAEGEGCESCHPRGDPAVDPAQGGPDDNMVLVGPGQDTSELPGVPFDHFTHASVHGHKLSCTSCHHTGELVSCSQCHGNLAVVKDGAVVPDRRTALHETCISCHEAKRKADPESTAPVTCEDCHSERDLPRLPGTLSAQRAAHLSCIGCHREVKAENPAARAPTDRCEDCHDGGAALARAQERRAKLAALTKVPDEPVLTIDYAAEQVAPTAFPHAAHVDRGISCQACHHTGLAQPRCSNCHKDAASAQQAFHGVCWDCHKEQGGPTECQDCHPGYEGDGSEAIH